MIQPSKESNFIEKDTDIATTGNNNNSNDSNANNTNNNSFVINTRNGISVAFDCDEFADDKNNFNPNYIEKCMILIE